MNKTLSETASYFRDFKKGWSQRNIPVEVVLAPPFTALAMASSWMNQDALSDVTLAAQNVYFENAGAFTGEISAEMLFELGCRYVIIGHSERRHLFEEDDRMVRQKIKAVRKAGLLPILCIGETNQERKAEKTWEVLKRQLASALKHNASEGSLRDDLSDWMIAYEPVWAIGTGETPSSDETAEIHCKIQRYVDERISKDRPRVLYGGSVSERNIASFMNKQSIDGVLVGGASLSADSFLRIIELGAIAKEASQIKQQGET